MYSRHSRNSTPANLLNRSKIFKSHTQYSRQKPWEIQLLSVSELKKSPQDITKQQHGQAVLCCYGHKSSASFQRKCILVLQAPPVLLTASGHEYLTIHTTNKFVLYTAAHTSGSCQCTVISSRTNVGHTRWQWPQRHYTGKSTTKQLKRKEK